MLSTYMLDYTILAKRPWINCLVRIVNIQCQKKLLESLKLLLDEIEARKTEEALRKRGAYVGEMFTERDDTVLSSSNTLSMPGEFPESSVVESEEEDAVLFDCPPLKSPENSNASRGRPRFLTMNRTMKTLWYTPVTLQPYSEDRGTLPRDSKSSFLMMNQAQRRRIVSFRIVLNSRL